MLYSCNLLRKGMFAVSILLAFASCNLFNSRVDGPDYYAFKESQDGKWGLISSDGKVLFKDEFKEEPIPVYGDRFFVKNAEGEYELYTAEEKPQQVGKETYKDITLGSSEEPIWAVVRKDQPIEFIDKDGRVTFIFDKVNGKRVDRIFPFHNGVAIFEAEGKRGLVSNEGKVIFNPEKVLIEYAGYGKYWVIDSKLSSLSAEELSKSSSSISLYGEDGKKMTDFKLSKYEGFHDFNSLPSFLSETCFAYPEKIGEELCYGLKNEKGEWIIKPSKKVRNILSIDGKRFIYSDGNAKGVMDFEGNILLRAKYDILTFANHSDLLFAKDKNDYQLINLDGEQVGKDMYKGIVHAFNNDYALVKVGDNEVVYIDTDGVEKKLDTDIYECSTFFMEHYLPIASDYIDYTALLDAFAIKADGIGGVQFGQGVLSTINALNSFDTAEEFEKLSTSPEDYKGKKEFEAKRIILGLKCEFAVQYASEISDWFNDGKHFLNPEKEYIIAGVSDSRLDGAKYDKLYQALLSRVEKLGVKHIKSNKFASIFKIGDNYMFCANSKDENYVVLFLTKRDISNYNLPSYDVDKDKSTESSFENDSSFDVDPSTDYPAVDSAEVVSIYD